MSVISKFDDERTSAFAENLLQLRHKRSGLLFSCGALHAKKLVETLKQRGLSDDDIIYYFPHSTKRYDDDVDCVKMIFENQGIESRSVCLSSEEEVRIFAQKIIKEIKCKNRRYTAEISGGTYSSTRLSELFHIQFKAVTRPGYWVDAVLDVDESFIDVQSISERLQQAGIQTSYDFFQQHKHLIVPEVNSTEVIKKLKEMPEELFQLQLKV